LARRGAESKDGARVPGFERHSEGASLRLNCGGCVDSWLKEHSVPWSHCPSAKKRHTFFVFSPWVYGQKIPFPHLPTAKKRQAIIKLWVCGVCVCGVCVHVFVK
jgi:hypothetical protein